ncbi:hypothetical protein ACFTY8_40640 [Streptomyces mirabilis]|uniref:hypothetical protein n=1 Tax=Streptomyces mirabilis TaxID=68239 RepID=UPI0036376A93
MLFIGLLLLTASGALTGLAIADNLPGGPEYTVSVLDHGIATPNALAIFCSSLALAWPWRCEGRHTGVTARALTGPGSPGRTMTGPHPPQH